MAELMKFNKEQIAGLATSSKNAGEQLKDMWNGLKEKSLSTLDASWAGKDAAAYTTKVLEKENSVLAVCAALELLSKKFTEALELIKNNEEDAYRAIENGGGSGRTPDGGYVTEPAPTDAPVPPTSPLPTVSAPSPAEEPQKPVETPPPQAEVPIPSDISAPPEVPTVSASAPSPSVVEPQQPVAPPPTQAEVPIPPDISAPPEVPTVPAPSPSLMEPQQPASPPNGGYSPTRSYIEGKTTGGAEGTNMVTQMTMIN